MSQQDEDTVKVTFTETRVVDDQHKGTANEQRFEAGKTYSLSPRSADRWVKRGVAAFASDEDAARGAGASSNVSLNLQDRDRQDPLAPTGQVEGTGSATDGQGNGDGGDGGGEVDYSKMKADQLKTHAKDRGLDFPSNASKGDLQKMLERRDTVDAAIAAKDFDVLHVDELRDLAEKEQIDLTGKSSKTEIVDAVSGHYKPAA